MSRTARLTVGVLSVLLAATGTRAAGRESEIAPSSIAGAPDIKNGEWHGKTAKGDYAGLSVKSGSVEWFAASLTTHCGNSEPSGIRVFNGQLAKVSGGAFTFKGAGSNACGEFQITVSGKFVSDTDVSGTYRITAPKNATFISEGQGTFQAGPA